jgi:hypothetical protein
LSLIIKTHTGGECTYSKTEGVSHNNFIDQYLGTIAPWRLRCQTVLYVAWCLNGQHDSVRSRLDLSMHPRLKNLTLFI